MAAGCLTSRGMIHELRGKSFRMIHDAFLFFSIACIIHTGCPDKVVVFESQNLEKELIFGVNIIKKFISRLGLGLDKDKLFARAQSAWDGFIFSCKTPSSGRSQSRLALPVDY